MKKNQIILTIVLLAIIAGGVFYFSQNKKGDNQDDDVIKIGAILPLSGSTAIIGEPKKKAFELAQEELNGSGSIHFKILYEDSKGNPKDGVSAFQKLLLDNTIDYYYIDLTTVVNSAVPLINKNNVIAFAGSAEPEVTTLSKNLFRLFAGGNQEIKMISDYLDKNNYNNVFVLHTNELYGHNSLKYFQKEFSKNESSKILGSEEYPMNNTDFRSLLAKIKALNVQKIVLFGYGNEYASLLKQAKEYGISPDAFVCNIGGSNKSIIDLEGQFTEGLVFVAPKFSYLMMNNKLSSTMQQFVDKYKEKYDELPDFRAAYTYDIIKILMHIWSKDSQKISKEKTFKELFNIKNYEGASGKITFLNDGDATTDLVLGFYRGGEIELIQ